MRMKRVTLFVLLSLLCFACAQNKKEKQDELLVFCAASLTNVVSELVEIYEAKHNCSIQLNFASSGTLARQIEHGAQAAVFISANEKWVDYLTGLHLMVPETKKKVAGNSMVVIAPANSDIDFLSFEHSFTETFKGRLAIGDPKHVPAGDYAWQAIENAGYAKALDNRILPAKDVRSAMMVVELGEVEMGIVYKTDALQSRKVKIITEIPSELYSPIGFYAMVLKQKNDEQGQLFNKFLSSNEAKTIWIKHGFKIE